MEAAYNRAPVVAFAKLDPMGPKNPASKEQELHWKGMDAFRPDLKAIKAPVFSFYSILEQHPAVDDKTSQELRVKAEKIFKEVIQPYQLNNVAQFHKDVPPAKVVVLWNTNHYFFEDPKQKEGVVATMRDFLSGKD